MGKRHGKLASGIRPTTSKVLESMMSILAPVSEGVRALDLFAGTGEVGMALLDQGAAEVTFVEGDAMVARLLSQRIRVSEHRASCKLLGGKIPKALEKLKGQFDMLLVDPPYDWPDPKTLLPATARLVAPGAIMVVEHHHKTLYDETAGWSLYRLQKYGETRLSFFRFEADLLVDPLHEAVDQRADAQEDGDRPGVVAVEVDQPAGAHGEDEKAEK